MKTRNDLNYFWLAALLLLPLSQAGDSALGAADQVEELLQDQSKARREEKVKELQRQERIENLKRDQDASQSQRQLEQLKQEKTDPSQPHQPKAAETQRQLDQQRNEQQLQRLQSEQ